MIFTLPIIFIVDRYCSIKSCRMVFFACYYQFFSIFNIFKLGNRMYKRSYKYKI